MASHLVFGSVRAHHKIFWYLNNPRANPLEVLEIWDKKSPASITKMRAKWKAGKRMCSDEMAGTYGKVLKGDRRAENGRRKKRYRRQGVICMPQKTRERGTKV